MDDILLGHDEAKDIEQAAMVAVWQRGGDITEQLLAGEKAVLRAQVRKVLRPSPGHWTSCPEWEASMCKHFKGDSPCDDCWGAYELVQHWQALRATAEEVRG